MDPVSITATQQKPTRMNHVNHVSIYVYIYLTAIYKP
jgi:hypothetical protein